MAANSLAHVPEEFTQDFAMHSDLVPRSAADPAQLLREQQQAADKAELVSLRATVARLLDDVGRSAAAPLHGVAHTEFLSMLAHELRNPLQSMAMASQLLAFGAGSDASVAHAHGVLERQIDHMSRLLDDLLDASRVASGKLVLQMAPVRLRDVIAAAVETSQSSVHLRGQNVLIDLPDQASAVTGDLVRLAQVFSNLLTNASQFSDIGRSIAVTVVCNDGHADITVTDQGSGIPVELQPFVFDMFTQGQRTLERAPGGLGLGLSLVRMIVKMHGGTATVFSQGSGLGSSFTVRLPLALAALPVPAAPAATAPPASARRILVIEDNVDANEIWRCCSNSRGTRSAAVLTAAPVCAWPSRGSSTSSCATSVCRG
ncbi:sensor histidine kinase [Massilia sp. DWR3-1-1]|uniref:sensor histidine kinase n=1 Tax=Massilia sp. DWR3-1-1 TaxID=2804559 RepID=UPI003CFBA035